MPGKQHWRGFSLYPDVLDPSRGGEFALCHLAVVWFLCLKEHQNTVVKVLNGQLMGWMGEWTLCSRCVLKPEPRNNRAANDLSRKSQVNTWWGGCVPWGGSASWSPVSTSKAMAPRQCSSSASSSEHIRKVFLLTPKPTLSPTCATLCRLCVFEIEVKGWEIKSIRKTKTLFAPWDTSMNQKCHHLSQSPLNQNRQLGYSSDLAYTAVNIT